MQAQVLAMLIPELITNAKKAKVLSWAEIAMLSLGWQDLNLATENWNKVIN